VRRASIDAEQVLNRLVEHYKRGLLTDQAGGGERRLRVGCLRV